MYKKILVAIDGSHTSARALAAAITLARDNAAELRPLYVVDNPVFACDALDYDPSALLDALTQEGQAVIRAAQADMAMAGVSGTAEIIEVDNAGEDVAQRIYDSAARMRADLVVLGTHGRRGFERLFLGSVAERFLRLACCPVLLITAEHPAKSTQKTRSTQTDTVPAQAA